MEFKTLTCIDNIWILNYKDNGREITEQFASFIQVKNRIEELGFNLNFDMEEQ